MIMRKNKKITRTRMTFARNLRKFRTLRKLSQEDLAELADLHRTYIGSVERCERNISIDNMERLAKALGLRVLDLVREEPE